MNLRGDLHSHFGPDLSVLESTVGSIRDVRSAFVEVALTAAESQKRVLLGLTAPFVTAARLEREWSQFVSVLAPEVRQLLALAAVGRKGRVALPPDPLTEAAAELLASAAHDHTMMDGQPPAHFRWDRKRFEVFGVLLDAWLNREPPLPIQEIGARSGVSYPTVNVTLRAMSEHNEIVRTTSRSAALTSLPRRSLEELVPRLNELRETQHYVDASGRGSSPDSLLTRLRRKPIRGVQLGGVAAAREYWPGLDLNGLPRLDLTVRWDAPAWLQTLDPALQRAPPSAPNVVLAVHHARAPLEPLAPRARRGTVVFDLYSLGLSEQAEAFLRHSRS